jgi:hypothetical protein
MAWLGRFRRQNDQKNFLSRGVPAILHMLADGLAKEDKVGLHLKFSVDFHHSIFKVPLLILELL